MITESMPVLFGTSPEKFTDEESVDAIVIDLYEGLILSAGSRLKDYKNKFENSENMIVFMYSQ